MQTQTMTAQSAAPSARAGSATNRFLAALCRALAVAGGLLLVAMALMSVASIVGRWLFAAPIIGDYELIEITCAMATSMTLPYAHFIGAHVIVDFFSSRFTARASRRLDGLASALLAAVAALVAWQMAQGLHELRLSHDTSLMLNLPTWVGYVPMVASFALLAVVAAYRAVVPTPAQPT